MDAVNKAVVAVVVFVRTLIAQNERRQGRELWAFRSRPNLFPKNELPSFLMAAYNRGEGYILLALTRNLATVIIGDAAVI